jgi:hypothetical protein
MTVTTAILSGVGQPASPRCHQLADTDFWAAKTVEDRQLFDLAGRSGSPKLPIENQRVRQDRPVF